MVDSNSMNIPKNQNQVYFNCNLLTYIYQDNNDNKFFEIVEFVHNEQMDLEGIHRTMGRLNNNDKDKQLRDIYGENVLDIPTPPFIKWMSRELTRPFHLI